MLQSVNGVGTQPLSLSNLHLHSRLAALSRVLTRRLRSALLVTRIPTSAALPGATSGPGSGDLNCKSPRRAPPGGCAGAGGRGRGQRERAAGHAHPQVASSPERLRAGAGPGGGAFLAPVPTCPRFLPPRACAYNPGYAPLPVLFCRLPLPPGLTGKKFRGPLDPHSLSRASRPRNPRGREQLRGWAQAGPRVTAQFVEGRRLMSGCCDAHVPPA